MRLRFGLTGEPPASLETTAQVARHRRAPGAQRRGRRAAVLSPSSPRSARSTPPPERPRGSASDVDRSRAQRLGEVVGAAAITSTSVVEPRSLGVDESAARSQLETEAAAVDGVRNGAVRPIARARRRSGRRRRPDGRSPPGGRGSGASGRSRARPRAASLRTGSREAIAAPGSGSSPARPLGVTAICVRSRSTGRSARRSIPSSASNEPSASAR